LLNKAVEIHDVSQDLKKKWHENDLPPIAQDYTDIVQTDFNPFDPFEE